MTRFVLFVAALFSFALTIPAVAVDMKQVTEGTAAAAKKQVVDINSASQAELKSIPGIGDAYAKKIIGGRPYASKEELLSKKILPKGVYEKVKDWIVVKK